MVGCASSCRLSVFKVGQPAPLKVIDVQCMIHSMMIVERGVSSIVVMATAEGEVGYLKENEIWIFAETPGDRPKLFSLGKQILAVCSNSSVSNIIIEQ